MSEREPESEKHLLIEGMYWMCFHQVLSELALAPGVSAEYLLRLEEYLSTRVRNVEPYPGTSDGAILEGTNIVLEGIRQAFAEVRGDGLS